MGETYKCEVCNIVLNKPDKECHDNGRKHRRNLQMASKNTATHDTQNTIPASSRTVRVVGYPPYTRKFDLRDALKDFRPFEITRFHQHYAVITLADEELAKAIIDEQEYLLMHGKKLKVDYFKPEKAKQAPKPGGSNQEENKKNKNVNTRFIMSKSKEMIIMPEELDLSGGFELQCESILYEVRLTREEVESMSLLFSNLTELFQVLWPGCTAVPFGSITTGLGIKTSDADCFINIPEQYNKHGNKPHVPRARTLMKRYPHIFAEILSIPRANTPIVKFFHIPTAMNCDVSFKSPLGTRNSKLIAFYLRTDQRILNLCILIKYWAKIHELTGSSKMSNYALTLLVIFYLQQEPSPLLHSVQTLQRGQLNIVDGWNTGFINEHHLLPRLENNSSLKDLLGGFFKFYKQFKFNEFVVCPYLGVALPRTHFENVNNLSDVFDIYKEHVRVDPSCALRMKALIVIQDPFEQCKNVSSCVGFNLYQKIIQSIEWAADIYEKDVKNGSDVFLKDILLQKPIIKPVVNTNFKIFMNYLILRTLPDDTWMQLVENAFISIFKDILQFSVSKQQKNKDATDSSKKNIVTYLCKASKLVWHKTVVPEANEDFLTCMTQKIGKDKNAKDISMHILADIVCFKQERKSHIVLKEENDTHNNFSLFGRYCISNLPMWFPKLLTPHAKTEEVKADELINTNASTSKVQEKANESVNNEHKDETESEIAEIKETVNDDASVQNSSKCKDVPILKNEFSGCQDSSPDSNPPTKIQKKE